MRKPMKPFVCCWIAFASLGNAAECRQLSESMNGAVRLEQQGKLLEAEKAVRAVVADAERSDCEHPRPDEVLTRLGHLLQFQGRLGQAEEAFRRALALRIQRDGPESPAAALSLSDLATTLVEQGRWSAAEDLLRRSIRILDAARGPNHFDALMVRNNLGVLLLKTGRHARAEPVLRSVAAGFSKIEPRPVQILASCYQNLAAALYGQGELSGAEHFSNLHLELMREINDSDGILAALSNLIAVDIQGDRIREADARLHIALQLSAASAGDVGYAHLLAARGSIRKRQKLHVDAAADLSAAIAILETAPIDVKAELARSLDELASLLRERGCKKEFADLQERIKVLQPDGSRQASAGPAFRISQIAFRPD